MTKQDTVGIGIIGTGFARTTQIPGFLACEGARVVAIASGRKENAERVARDFGIEYSTDNWREVIARDDVNLISIVTPPVMHQEMALAAIEAGKAVLCEKPMAMNASEAQTMMKAAQKAGVLAHINHELRFLTNRQKMRAMIADGEIGEINHAKILFRSDYRIGMNWNWWSQREAGGGTLGAIGSHAVDSLRWMLGANIEEVYASLSTHFAERFDEGRGEMRPVTSDDEANLLLRFADQGTKSRVAKTTTASLSLSVVESGRTEHYLEVFGTRGALRIEERGDLWHAEVGAGDWKLIADVAGDLAPGIKRDSGWGRGWTAFSRALVNALREGRTSVENAASFEDGFQTQIVLDAARRSNESGQRVMQKAETRAVKERVGH